MEGTVEEAPNTENLNEYYNIEAIIDYYHGDEYDHKYIICTVTGQKGKRLALVSKKLRYHSRIADAYEVQLARGERLTVHGGGILRIEPKHKKVSTYGTSGGYGAPERGVVESILKKYVEECLQGWELDVKITNFVRD